MGHFVYLVCMYLASACAQVPCLNGATCLDDPPGYYRCICDEGYEGSVCENGK